MLLNREQSLQDQVGRSQIPNSYKTKLYEKHNSTCANCGQRYEHKYLAPDHRVPSIVESDDLSAMNYLTKLQTLCVRCNQVKRESCKKCPYEHKCRQCEWAFPEKYGVSASQVRQLRQLGDKKGLTAREMLKELIDKYS